MRAVLYNVAGTVATISLNRPEVLNAYNVEMRDDLFEALNAARDDPAVRAVVLQGNGRAFCSGGDVREFGSAPSPVRARDVRFQRDVWGTLKALPMPTIASVHGCAVGSGFEMAMLCDFCVATDDAYFALPETGMAMIPGVAGTQTAARLTGLGRALDLVLTGRRLSASEAARLGLVQRVVPPNALRDAVAAFVNRLAVIEPDLVARTKRAVNEGLDLPLADALAFEARLAGREPFDRRMEVP